MISIPQQCLRMWCILYSITKVTQLLLGCLLARLLAFTKSGKASQAHQNLLGRLVSNKKKALLGLVEQKKTNLDPDLRLLGHNTSKTCQQTFIKSIIHSKLSLFNPICIRRRHKSFKNCKIEIMLV